MEDISPDFVDKENDETVDSSIENDNVNDLEQSFKKIDDTLSYYAELFENNFSYYSDKIDQKLRPKLHKIVKIFSKDLVPDYDIIEKDSCYIIIVDMSGAVPEIKINGNILKVRGYKYMLPLEENEQIYYKEIRNGKYKRQIILPLDANLNLNDATVDLVNGQLHIVITKVDADGDVVKKISVE